MSQDDVEAMIADRMARQIAHLDRMLALGHISVETYTKALAELHQWARVKRDEVLQ